MLRSIALGLVCLLSFPLFAQAGAPIPTRLLSTLESLVLHTDEGFVLARRVLNIPRTDFANLREHLTPEGIRVFRNDSEQYHAFLNRLAEDDMEAFSRDLAQRLEKLEGDVPAGDFVMVYREFARHELALETERTAFINERSAATYASRRADFLQPRLGNIGTVHQLEIADT